MTDTFNCLSWGNRFSSSAAGGRLSNFSLIKAEKKKLLKVEVEAAGGSGNHEGYKAAGGDFFLFIPLFTDHLQQ